MKYILISFLLILMSSSLQSQVYISSAVSVDNSGDTVTNNIFHRLYVLCQKKDSPYSGIDTVYLKDALRGEIKNIVYFENGEKIKVVGFFNNGNKFREVSFKNCEKEGVDVEWYKNGNKMFLSYYEKGKEMCPLIYWNEDGSLHLFSDCKGDTIISSQFENWRLVSREISIKNSENKKSFVHVIYHYSGNILSVVTLNAGYQLYREFYENKHKRIEGYIFNSPDWKVGQWIHWYENGKKEMEEYYQLADDEKKANIKTGTWSYWDKKGNLKKQEIYENNVLKKTINYPKKK